MRGSLAMTRTGIGASDDALQVGQVLRAHGVRGELGVRLHWEQSNSLYEVERVTFVTQVQTREFVVQSARPAGKGVLLKVAGIDDRDAAEQWRGARISIRRDALPPLASGEYYLADLVGYAVLAPDGAVGTVREVLSYPSVDCVVIETPEGQCFEQPLLPQWLQQVDPLRRQVLLSSREGLIE